MDSDLFNAQEPSGQTKPKLELSLEEVFGNQDKPKELSLEDVFGAAPVSPVADMFATPAQPGNWYDPVVKPLKLGSFQNDYQEGLNQLASLEQQRAADAKGLIPDNSMARLAPLLSESGTNNFVDTKETRAADLAAGVSDALKQIKNAQAGIASNTIQDPNIFQNILTGGESMAKMIAPTVAGTIIGGPFGGMAASGATMAKHSYDTSKAQSLIEYAQANGLDLSNQVDMAKAMADIDFVEQRQLRANLSGGVGGATGVAFAALPGMAQAATKSALSGPVGSGIVRDLAAKAGGQLAGIGTAVGLGTADIGAKNLIADKPLTNGMVEGGATLAAQDLILRGLMGIPGLFGPKTVYPSAIPKRPWGNGPYGYVDVESTPVQPEQPVAPFWRQLGNTPEAATPEAQATPVAPASKPRQISYTPEVTATPEAQVTPVAPAPVELPKPAQPEAPVQNILESELAKRVEAVRFVRAELAKREAQQQDEKKNGVTNPETSKSIDRLRARLEGVTTSLNDLKDSNAPRSEIPVAKPEPTTQQILDQKTLELNAVNKELGNAYRRNADERTIALLEADHERISVEYEIARDNHDNAQSTIESKPEPAVNPKYEPQIKQQKPIVEPPVTANASKQLAANQINNKQVRPIEQPATTEAVKYTGGNHKEDPRFSDLNLKQRGEVNSVANDLANTRKAKERAIADGRSTKNLDVRIDKQIAEVDRLLGLRPKQPKVPATENQAKTEVLAKGFEPENIDRIEHAQGDKFNVYNKQGQNHGTSLDGIRKWLPKFSDEANRQIESAGQTEEPTYTGEDYNPEDQATDVSAEPKTDSPELIKAREQLAKQKAAGNDKQAEKTQKRIDKMESEAKSESTSQEDSQSAEDWADEKIKQGRRGRMNALPADLLLAYAIKAAYISARGIKTFGEWSAEMIKEFGENIRPHLKEIFAKMKDPELKSKAQDMIDAERPTGPLTAVEAAESTARLTARKIGVYDFTYTDPETGKEKIKSQAAESLEAARKEVIETLKEELNVKNINVSAGEAAGEFDAYAVVKDAPASSTLPKISKSPSDARGWSRLYAVADRAAAHAASLDDLGLGVKGWVESMGVLKSGSTGGVIPPPPEQLLNWFKNPAELKSFIESSIKENPLLMRSALEGLASLKESHDAAQAGKIHPMMVAAHMNWGLLSRMLDPYNQEAGWIRLFNDPEIIQHVRDSVEGKFKLDKDGWKALVKRAMERKEGETKAGRGATSNANAYFSMLSKWNGRWDELTAIINNKDLNISQRRKAFYQQGFGGAGIKHKVLSFVLATLCSNEPVVLDRWQVVNFWMPLLKKFADARAAKGGSPDIFSFDKNGVPEDTTGAYSLIGSTLNDNAVAEASYQIIENALKRIAEDNKSWLNPLMGKGANESVSPFEMHWLLWNIIKKEPVGHSSLDSTTQAMKTGLYDQPDFPEQFAKLPKQTEKYIGDGKFQVFESSSSQRPTVTGRDTEGNSVVLSGSNEENAVGAKDGSKGLSKKSKAIKGVEDAAKAGKIDEKTMGEKIDQWADDTLGDGKLHSPTPDVILAMAWKASKKIAAGLMKFSDWAKQHVAEFGDWVKPHLKKIWNKALPIARGATDIATLRYYSDRAGKLWEISDRHAADAAAGRSKPSPTLRTLANMIHSRSGSDADAVNNDIPSRIYLLSNQISNRYANIIAKFRTEFAGMSEAQRQQWDVDFRDYVLGRRKPPAGKVADAVESYKRFMNELRNYQVNAGIEMGDVGNNYFPRVTNTDAINADMEGFVSAASRMYRMKDFRNGEVEKTSDEYEVLARQWLHRILNGSVDEIKLNTTSIESSAPSHADARTFTEDEAKLIDKYLSKDITKLTLAYTANAVRKAETARAFGADGKKFTDMMVQLQKDGVSNDKIEEVADLVRRSLGIGTEKLSKPVAKFVDWTNVSIQAGLLGGSFVYNVFLEPVTFGTRTGSPLMALRGIASTWRNLGEQISRANPRGIKDKLEAKYGTRLEFAKSVQEAIAENLGLVNVEIERANVGAHWNYEAEESGSPAAKWLSNLAQHATLMHQTEHAKTVASVKMAELAVRSNAQYLLGESKMQKLLSLTGMDFSAPESSAILFREMGIPDAKHKSFAQWVMKINGLKDAEYYKEVMGNTEEAAYYRQALQRTSLGMSVKANPSLKMSRSDRLEGRLQMQLQNYSFAYGRMVNSRMWNMAKGAVTPSSESQPGKPAYTKTKMDRARMFAPTLLVAPLAIMAAEFSKQLIHALWPSEGTQMRDDQSDEMKLFDDASFAGVFGPKVELATKILVRDQLPGGPAVEAVGKTAGFTAKAVIDDKESASAEQRAAKQVYNVAGRPALVLGAGAVHPFFGFMANAVAKDSDTRDAFIEATTGEPYKPNKK